LIGKSLSAATVSGLLLSRTLYSRVPTLAVPAGRIQFCALSAALNTVAAGRSARKEGGGVRIRVDPVDLF